MFIRLRALGPFRGWERERKKRKELDFVEKWDNGLSPPQQIFFSVRKQTRDGVGEN